MKTAQHRYSTDSAVHRRLVAAAVDLIDEDGGAAISVRTLARRTHYSASSVSYHLSPMDDFLGHVWRRIATDFLTVLGEIPVDERWPEVALSSVLDWMDEHPHRARFAARHYPVVEPGAMVEVLKVVRIDASCIPHTLLMYVIRRLQAAIDYALDLDHAGARSVLCAELSVAFKACAVGREAFRRQ